eukprot:1363916-Rhodomonas_salina.1
MNRDPHVEGEKQTKPRTGADYNELLATNCIHSPNCNSTTTSSNQNHSLTPHPLLSQTFPIVPYLGIPRAFTRNSYGRSSRQEIFFSPGTSPSRLGSGVAPRPSPQVTSRNSPSGTGGFGNLDANCVAVVGAPTAGVLPVRSTAGPAVLA